MTGVALLLVFSLALRSYLAYFHRLTTAYGSLGAVILLLLWFYLIGFAILMGGEVNSEIARALDARNERAGIARPKRQPRRRRLLRRRKAR